MENLTYLRAGLPAAAHPIRLHVITRKARGNIAELIASAALNGPLTLIAGNEWLPTYEIPRMLRRHTTQVRNILNHVRLARAFTCYQMRDILEHTPAIREPLLLINFLFTFEDEDIDLQVRTKVLEDCIAQLTALALSRPVALVIQVRATAEYEQFYPYVEAIAHEIVNVEAQDEPTPPLRLF